ncbi:acyltransferase [Streptomyces sp. NPDC005438]|uniref:acyltransferase family protein n=1 Tax=Streptomyces sp. NPDC005438 TaxID=3156880 RepID=UPI0033BDE06E
MSRDTTPTQRPAKRGTPGLPPEGAPPRTRTRELEGFRGLAALSTVVFHVWQQYYRYDAEGAHPPVDNPFLGGLISLEVIDLFFVMSAYLLTISYARAAIDGKRTRPAGAFLYRRMIRIVPLYFLAVLLVWALRNPTLPGNWLDLFQHLTFTQVLSKEQIFYTIGPTWSLSLEVIFYLSLVLLGPLAARLCRPLRRRTSRVALCLVGCALLYLLPLVWISVAHYGMHVPHTEWPVYFGPQARYGGFAAGMALAVATVALKERGRLSRGPAIVLRVIPLVLVYALSYHTAPENFAATYFHPLSSALWMVLLYATLHTNYKGRWASALSRRWITAVGLVSYSLYIWHEPVMLELDKFGLLPASQSGFPWAVLIVLLVALPLATCSYWLVEYPASLLGRLRNSDGSRRDFYPEPEGAAETEPQAGAGAGTRTRPEPATR